MFFVLQKHQDIPKWFLKQEKFACGKYSLMVMAFMLRLMDVLNSLRNSDLAAKEDFPMPSNLLASYKYSAWASFI